VLQKLVRKIWQATPAPVRVNLIWFTQKKFTVSAAAIIFNRERKVLLLNHILRPLSAWGIPGGFIDANEQPEEAIRRELREETGIELEDLALYRVRTIGRHVEILFTARGVGDPQVKSREILEFGWFTPDEMPEGTSKIQKYIIEELLTAEVDKKSADD
jgi:ADP-ribose pyrophosphatase YjhB (NUDIX family)